MANRKYQDIKKSIIRGSSEFDTLSSSDDKDNTYYDIYATRQQKDRDSYISSLLKEYVEAYQDKRCTNKFYRKIIFFESSISLGIFIALFISVIFMVFFHKFDTSIEGVLQLISLYLTFITLIFGILTIITKYVFPENDEEYITRIVESIQKNDLENKKENIKANEKLVK